MVKEWLDHPQLQTMEWPGNSTDLNPIQICWKIKKYKVMKKGQYVSIPRLIDSIKKIWTKEMDPSYFKLLSNTMPQDLHVMLKAKGQMTKY